MQCLPPVVRDGWLVTLPLCDPSAEALFAALLTADAAGRCAVLVDALAWDPALALWTILMRDGAGCSGPPAALSDLAESLAERLGAWLRWPASSAVSQPDEFPSKEACAALAARGVVEALDGDPSSSVTIDSSVPQLPGGFAPRYLSGLLHHAADWLSLCGGAAVSEADLRAKLPAWLRRDHERSAAAGTSKIPERLSPAAEAADAEAQHRWQREIPVARLLGELAERLARLHTLQNHFDQVLEDEKLQAMYKLAAGAGHEINNPLGSIAGRAQLLLRDETDPERRRTLSKINAQAFRAHEMIADMMLFARPPAPAREPVDLVRLVDEVLVGLRDAAEERQIQLLRGPAESPVVVEADGSQLRVALRAMCVNALEAIGGGGHIDVTARRVAQQESTAAPSSARSASAEIVIHDDGPGITADVRQHLFDPFYSGREAGRGLGFGLSKCWRIVANHGGRIDVESTPGHGARFTITLPA